MYGLLREDHLCQFGEFVFILKTTGNQEILLFEILPTGQMSFFSPYIQIIPGLVVLPLCLLQATSAISWRGTGKRVPLILSLNSENGELPMRA